MKLLSSIFSFDTLRGQWKIPPCVIFATVVIIVAELLLARTDFIFKWVPDSEIGTLLSLEKSIVQAGQKPVVLIFGSSIANHGFSPRLMEKLMGLQRGQVLDLSFGGARPFNALKIYERNRKILRQADIIIIEVEAWHLSVGIPPSNIYRYLAGWSDILAYERSDFYSLMRSFFFRLPDVAPILPALVTNVINGKLETKKLHEPSVQHENEFTPEALRTWVTLLYSDYKYSKVFERHLVQLMSLAKEDGAKVFLVQMPMPDGYVSLLKQHDGDPYGRFRKNVSQAVDGLADRVEFWEFASEAGLTNDDYGHWGHLTDEGAAKWTQFFVQWLKTS